MSLRKREADPSEVMSEMRELAFTLPANQLGLEPGPGHTRVWSVLMETGYPEAVVSLVTIAEGTTSLYFSSGGGVIGAGEHATVRQMAERFIALVDDHVGEFEVADKHPLPDVGRVRFYVRTFDGLRMADADETELGEGRHTLSPLFHAGHAVITAVRETAPSP